ncbi:MAG: divergent PAP2 family protein [Candidatus Nanoarchaeia archaeon]
MTAILNEILQAPIFLEVAIVTIACQMVKIATKSYEHKKFYWQGFVENGGMPSLHTTLTVSLATSIGLSEGFASPLFFVTTVFTAIVMRDAMGARRNVDILTDIVNRVIRKEHVHMKPAEMITGHTPLQVGTGFVFAVLGVLIMHSYVLA